MKSEIARRESNTDQVLALFQSRPLEWLTPREIAAVGGFSAWRTRVSEARELAEKSGMTIEWNKRIADSAYRLKPLPLGRSAERPTAQPSLGGWR